MDFLASGFPGFWVSGFLGFWVSGFLGFWVSGFLGFWVSGFWQQCSSSVLFPFKESYRNYDIILYAMGGN